MERKSKLMLLTGIVAGAASAYYLTTPKGKELRTKIAEKAKNAGDIVATKSTAVKDVVADKVASVASSIAETKEAVTEKATSAAIDKLGSLEKGIAKAKSKLQNGVTV